jgi:uncharacterized membrane protein required for colicin V production
LGTLFLFGHQGVVQVAFAVLAWLAGVAAASLLWRPASSAFFTITPAGPRN